MNVFRHNFSHRTAAVDFTALPPATLNNGVTRRCNPLVPGQPYFWMESDGQFWRPLNGSAVLYSLQAEVVGTDLFSEQIMIQISIPPRLLQVGSILRFTISGEHFGGTTDSGTIRVRMGALGTIFDDAMHSPNISTTNISMGSTQEYQVLSPTTIRKHGAGAASAVNAMVLASVVRSVAYSIADITTDTNIISLTVDPTAGGMGEYWTINGVVLELVA